MKALILSGGKGTRLRPLTYTRAKQLLPLANKPVLFYVIEALLAAGIRDIGIVIGDTGDEIRAEVGDGSRWSTDLRFSYIQQGAPLGLAHAVKVARPFLGDDRFIMILGDNIIEEGLTHLVNTFSREDCRSNCRIVLKSVPNPQDFGVAELAPKTTDPITGETVLRVKQLIEKPEKPPGNLALVGIYFFDAHIFQSIEAIKPSGRGELEITDAIQWLIEHGYSVEPYRLQGYWIDTGQMEDILEANRLMLGRLTPTTAEDSHIDAESSIFSTVIVQQGARILNSVVRGPAIIGARTTVVNSYIGPFTSIYHDVAIYNSEVEHSIVLEHSRIINIPDRIEDSLIGRYVEIQASPIKPKAYKFMLGDHSKVGLL